MKYTFGRWSGPVSDNYTGLSVITKGIYVGNFSRDGTFTAYDRQILAEPLKKYHGKKFSSPIECLKTINEVET